MAVKLVCNIRAHTTHTTYIYVHTHYTHTHTAHIYAHAHSWTKPFLTFLSALSSARIPVILKISLKYTLEFPKGMSPVAKMAGEIGGNVWNAQRPH